MRLNLPVIDREYPFPRGESLVSTTDLKGRILYCNAAFVTVSGYTREELLGQPHNLIRHPDIPEEAFRDLWETIASGSPWSATLKNRRKDGSHYWVMANVTPVVQGNRVVGYMSVRTEATREQIQRAEALYRRMQAEKEAGRPVHVLRAGKAELDTLRGRLQRRLRLTMARKLTLLAAGVGALGYAAGTAAAGLSGWALGGAVAAATVLAGLLGGGVARGLVIAPLRRLVDHANRMAAGDLTGQLDATRHDIIGQATRALSQLSVNLRAVVHDARAEVEHMRDATREIASGNRDLSSRTESQAGSLQQTAASMEQITATVRQAADSAARAAGYASDANAVAQRGSEAVEQVSLTMQEINESSQRIGEIIQVIDSIAFQTNILALNAAVEAARAGDQGRGFAVVAGEVRALSQRTTAAAREIKQLIEASHQKVEAGNRLTDSAHTTMREALAKVREVGDLIHEISSGAREQLDGMSQINDAVTNLDSITQQNSALVEQVAAAASSLEGQAHSVTEAVQVFHLEAAERRAAADAVALRRAMKQGRQEAVTA